MKPDVVVYDPNDENPTGAELSAALAELGLNVQWLLTEGASKISLVAPGVEARPVLAGPRPWTLRRVGRRLFGPFEFARHILRGRPGIAIWIHDPWDGVVLNLLGLIAPQRLYFIHNNPRSIRPRSGIAGKLERLLIRHCHVVVHTDWLRNEALKETVHHVDVIAHPNYTLTAASAPPRQPVANRVAFVGALRPDKGVDQIVESLLAAGGDFEFRSIGSGRLAEVDVDRLKQRGISYVATGRLDQAAFLQELAHADVVIAPYRQPTESGSVLLCMALGLPVLALESSTMQRILNADSRFSTPVELGAGLARFLKDPWPTFKLNPQHQREKCRADLEVALACQALCR